MREIKLGIPDYSAAEADEQIGELADLNNQLARSLYVPTGYMERYYDLRLYIRLVLDELKEHRVELLA